MSMFKEASVVMSAASGIKFFMNPSMTPWILHPLMLISASMPVLPCISLICASAFTGIDAISAVKSSNLRAGTLSFGKCILPSMVTGILNLPNDLVAIWVLNSVRMSICPSFSSIWNLSTPRASVSALSLPATNMLSRRSPSLLRDIFLVCMRPSNSIPLRSIMANTVSLLSV